MYLLILAERILTGWLSFCNLNNLKADIDQYHYTFIEEETKNIGKRPDGRECLKVMETDIVASAEDLFGEWETALKHFDENLWFRFYGRSTD